MVQINQDRGIMIMARKRYGKTTLMKCMLRELCTKYEIIIYNTNYEDFSDIENEHIAVFKPDARRVHDINYLSEVIMKLRSNMSNFVLVVIDLDAFFEGIGSQTTKAAELRNLYGTGGHQRIMPIVESKMPKYLPPKVITNNNLFYIGQFKDLDNQQRLRNYASPQELNSLERHQFIEVDEWNNSRTLVEVKGTEIVEIKKLGDVSHGRQKIHTENTSEGGTQEGGETSGEGTRTSETAQSRGAKASGEASGASEGIKA